MGKGKLKVEVFFSKLPFQSSLVYTHLYFFQLKNIRDAAKFSSGCRIRLKSTIWLCLLEAKDLKDT